MNLFKIALIGTGNLAWHLAKAFEDTPHKIVKIWGRNPQKVQCFTQTFNIKPQTSLNFQKEAVDIILLAVTDSALGEIIPQILLNEKQILAHTSGSTSIEIFQNYPKVVNYGVFYPLQTFSKNCILRFHEVPICIEANSVWVENQLFSLAEALSLKVYKITSQQRLYIHLAAVFANNFVNHLLGIAQEILNKENIPFELLSPLIQETIRKALESENIHTIQTGPARRNDSNTLEKHLQLLQNFPNLQHIYRVISQSIMHKAPEIN